MLPFHIIIHPTNNNAGIVAVKLGLNVTQQAKAQASIDLVQLTAVDTRPKVADLRWKMRREAMMTIDVLYTFFQESKQLPTFNAQVSALKIAIVAKTVGFFGIWFDTKDNFWKEHYGHFKNHLHIRTSEICTSKKFTAKTPSFTDFFLPLT